VSQHDLNSLRQHQCNDARTSKSPQQLVYSAVENVLDCIMSYTLAAQKVSIRMHIAFLHTVTL